LVIRAMCLVECPGHFVTTDRILRFVSV